jgi:hypothetical protein
MSTEREAKRKSADRMDCISIRQLKTFEARVVPAMLRRERLDVPVEPCEWSFGGRVDLPVLSLRWRFYGCC